MMVRDDDELECGYPVHCTHVTCVCVPCQQELRELRSLNKTLHARIEVGEREIKSGLRYMVTVGPARN